MKALVQSRCSLSLVVSYALLGWRVGLVTIWTHLAFKTEVDRIRLDWIEKDWTGLKLDGLNGIGLTREM